MFEPRRLDALLQTMTTRLPGVVACLAVDDRTVYQGAAGSRDVGYPARTATNAAAAATGAAGATAAAAAPVAAQTPARPALPMTTDTVIWLASMTKAITATAVMQQVERGRLDLDAPASSLLPALADVQVLTGFAADGQPQLRAPRSAPTLRQLLTHTSGHAYDFTDARLLQYQQVTGTPRASSGQLRALQAPLVADPGASWQYGIGIDWAGQMVEAVTDQRLGAYLREHVLGPLGMDDTAFVIGAAQRRRLAKVHRRDDDGKPVPADFEINQSPQFDFGGGGLYGTAPDYLRFARMIINRGQLDGVRLLKPATVGLMAGNHIGDLAVGGWTAVLPELSCAVEFMPGVAKKWGLSFLINTQRSAEGRSPGSLAWAGLANSFYWIDPQRRLAAVFATQLLPFCDPAALEAFRAFETEVYRQLDA